MLHRLQTDRCTSVVEYEVEILKIGVRDGEDGDPWVLGPGRGGSEGGGAVFRAAAEVSAGAAVLGVDVFAHGCFSKFRIWGCGCGERKVDVDGWSVLARRGAGDC